MALGAAGSSLAAELNRLAGISTPTSFLAEQGAANAWAGTSGKGIIAALNYKASSTRQPTEYKGLNDICNEIAGTSGLSAIAALRSIDL